MSKPFPPPRIDPRKSLDTVRDLATKAVEHKDSYVPVNPEWLLALMAEFESALQEIDDLYEEHSDGW